MSIDYHFTFGNARMLQTLCEEEGVFRTLLEAEQWLGIAPAPRRSA